MGIQMVNIVEVGIHPLHVVKENEMTDIEIIERQGALRAVCYGCTGQVHVGTQGVLGCALNNLQPVEQRFTDECPVVIGWREMPDQLDIDVIESSAREFARRMTVVPAQVAGQAPEQEE